MHHRQLLLASLLSLGLSGCAATIEQIAEGHVAYMVQADPRPTALQVCHGSSCHVRTMVDLGPADWSRVRALFDPPPANAAAERQRIGQAIGLIERLVAPQAGTASDVGRNKYAPDQSTQLDCIDEAVNSTTYLRLMAAGGLLRFHEVDLPAHRGGMAEAHNTATIHDLSNGERYAVDSSFYDNGVPAMVLTLADWKAGWDPQDPSWATLTAALRATQSTAQP